MKKSILLLAFVILFLFSGCNWFSDNPMFPSAKMNISAVILDESGKTVNTSSVGALSTTTINNTSTSDNESSVVNTTETETTNTVDNSQSTGTPGSTTTSTTTGTTTTTITSSTSDSSSTTDSTETNTDIKFARDVEFTFYALNNVGAEITQCVVQYKKLNGAVLGSLTKVLDVYLSVPYLVETPPKIVIEIFDPVVENYLVTNRIRESQALVTFFGSDFAGHSVSYKKSVYIKAY